MIKEGVALIPHGFLQVGLSLHAVDPEVAKSFPEETGEVQYF